ncbi:unnamed protein product [Caretta caretta]
MGREALTTSDWKKKNQNTSTRKKKITVSSVLCLSLRDQVPKHLPKLVSVPVTPRGCTDTGKPPRSVHNILRHFKVLLKRWIKDIVSFELIWELRDIAKWWTQWEQKPQFTHRPVHSSVSPGETCHMIRGRQQNTELQPEPHTADCSWLNGAATRPRNGRKEKRRGSFTQGDAPPGGR